MAIHMTAMIVDDEPLAREGLLFRLNQVEEIEVICSSASAVEAKLSLKNSSPDIIFLDIEMPGMSGLDLASWLQEQNQHCKIVFVTAFREFALDAFDFQAFDYLLKPFTDERFDSCINKLIVSKQEELAAKEHDLLNTLLINKTGNSIDKFTHKLKTSTPGKLNQMDKTLSLKSGTEWIRVVLMDIKWIEAAGDYMCINTDQQKYIVRKTMKQFEKELDLSIFTRVNRSCIINSTKIQKLSPNSNGEYYAHLACGKKIKVSRKYKSHLSELS